MIFRLKYFSCMRCCLSDIFSMMPPIFQVVLLLTCLGGAIAERATYGCALALGWLLEAKDALAEYAFF